MIERLLTESPRVLAFKLSGTLHDEDYKHFIPAVNAARAEGKVRILALFEDFHGWDTRALWDDIQFAAHHFSDIERVALVGDRKWEAWMAQVCKPFTQAAIRYFDVSESDAAWQWVREDI